MEKPIIKWDLAWGNSVAVREAFLDTYEKKRESETLIEVDDLISYDYPTHEGNPKLIEVTRQVIKRQTDQDYKHVFLVNGATGGVVIALRAYAQRGMQFCMTRNAPYYVRYPEMIKAAGLEQMDEENLPYYAVALLDIPSNPLGLISQIGEGGMPIILDGVYLNRVYAPIFYGLPHHEVMIGSYSKLLGINGIRVGWIGTNDDLLAERIKMLITSEYCGLSQASTDILLHMLNGFNWDRFEDRANLKLNYNRANWAKLEKYFGDTPVIDKGMFYYAPMDKKVQELLMRAGINWTRGSAMGTDDSFGRINLGQNNQLTEDAVKAFLKADQI